MEIGVTKYSNVIYNGFIKRYKCFTTIIKDMGHTDEKPILFK